MCLIAIPFKYSVFILFLYIGVEGAAKLLSRYHPMIHVGADILIIALSSKAAFILLLDRSELPKRVPFIIRLMGVHFFWFIIVFFNPYAISAPASMAAAKLYVTPLLLFIFGYLLCKDRKSTEYFLLAWVIVTTVHMLLSIYQGVIGPKSVTSWSPSYQIVLNRFFNLYSISYFYPVKCFTPVRQGNNVFIC